MHSTSNLEDGYFGSGKILRRSLNKHGKANHLKEILEWCEDRSSLKQREKELVNESLVSDTNCMNLQLGGGGGFTGEDHRQKFIEGGKPYTWTERWNDPEFYENKSKEASALFKRLHREGVFDNVNNRGMLGKNHSTESKQKMSETKKITGVCSGQNNSQFGLKWITNEVENSRVKPDKIEHYLKLGWTLGYNRRLMNDTKRKGTEISTCQFCKSEFIKKRKHNKYCSVECGRKGKWVNNKEYRIKISKASKDRAEKLHKDNVAKFGWHRHKYDNLPE